MTERTCQASGAVLVWTWGGFPLLRTSASGVRSVEVRPFPSRLKMSGSSGPSATPIPQRPGALTIVTTSAEPTTTRTTVKSVCPLDCPDTCGMVVTMEDGRAVGLRGDRDHPFTRGFLCQKMARYLDRVYSPDRLMHPLRRVGAKGTGRFERISWDDALDEIADRFRSIAESADGPQAILPYSYYGTMGRIQAESLDRRFFHRFGASMLDRTICAAAGGAGYEYTCGTGRLGADPLGVPGCKLILNWGSNTANTNSHLWSLMIEARKRSGATLVAIDPYRSPTARRCDWHIQPRPGTDASLALGLMHVIFRDGLQDDDYLARGTIGADRLKARVLEEYPVERVAAITDVDVETIEALARRYAAEHPSLIRLNYGLQRHGGGGMAVRTIACLPALVGSLAASWRRGAADHQWDVWPEHGRPDAPRSRPARHPHRQHEPACRGPGGRVAGASGEGAVCLQQ